MVSANPSIEKTISAFNVSPGSADTLVRRGGITNHRSIAYCLGNISAKNYQNRLMCFEVSVQHQCRFLRHTVYNKSPHQLECGPMPNVMAALPNIGGALCSMPQSLADAHYLTAVQ